MKNVSVDSKPDHPPGQFLMGEFPTTWSKRVQNPHLWTHKNELKPHPKGIFLNYSLQKHEKMRQKSCKAAFTWLKLQYNWTNLNTLRICTHVNSRVWINSQ